ncbi:MAG TPA: DUF4340 domain-containing protein [Nitrospiria bacterium]|nr:DUF4340 domain-containing protein [Nitrospiria bacterium]
MAERAGSVAWRRWRGLLLWTGVLLVLGAYLWLVDLPSEREAQKTSEQAGKLLPFDAGTATALVLTTADSTISLKRDQGSAWRILSPLKTDADQAAVQTLLMGLNNASQLRVIDENPTALERYGLAPAAVSLRLTVGGVEHEVEFGADSPVGASTYARILAAPETGHPADGGLSSPVLLVPRETKEAVDKKLFDLRRKELFDLAAADVSAMELHYPDQPVPLIRLERRAMPATGGAQAVAWQMVAPIHAAADNDVVRTLIKQVSSLRATAILDNEKNKKINELKKPKVEMTLHAGNRAIPVKYYFPLGEETAYAVTTPESPLYQVDRERVLQFEKTVFDLMDKRIVQLEPDAVQRLAVDRLGETYQLTRRGKDWLYNGQPLLKPAAEKVQKFLNALGQAKVEKIAGNSISAWSKLGLASGAIIITLFSGDQNNPLPVVVRLGKQEGKLLYVRKGDDVDSYITSTPLEDLLPTKQELSINTTS